VLLTTCKTAWADLRVTVRGAAEIDARVQTMGEALVIDGLLRDEAGVAISGGNIRATFEGTEAEVEAASRALKPCDESLKLAAGFHGRSDGTWRFCIRTSSIATAGRVTLEFPGTAMFDGAKVELPFDIGKHPLAIDFDTRGGEVSLDGEAFSVEVFAGREEGGLVVASSGHPIALTNETGKLLGSAVSDNSGRARFVVPGRELGPPGVGFLRARFEGDGRTLPAEARLSITRTARVLLRAEGPPGEVRTQDGFVINVQVDFETPIAAGRTTSRTAAEGDARVLNARAPRGTIEIFAQGVSIAAAPVEDGRAHIDLTLDRPRGEVELVLRYLPTHPWFVCHEDAVVRIHAKGAGPLRTIGLVVLCAAALALVIRSRRRATIAAPDRLASKSERPPTPHIEVVKRGRTDAPVWTGVVVDAHEELPIAGANISFTRRTFQGIDRLGTVVTDANGRFEIALREYLPTDDLSIEGPLHSELARQVPSPGELRIALVSRKRHILTRFVEWAAQRGLAPSRAREITPGEVRDRATAFATAQWAAEVERAAFGPEVVDANLEAHLDGLRAQATHEEAPPTRQAPAEHGMRLPLPSEPKDDSSD